MAPALVADGLGFCYGDTVALHAVSFTVAPGERVGLLGQNGSGKTTLFRIASTRLRPASGSVRIGGLDVIDHPDHARRQLGMVFQSPALDAALTCRESLQLHAALYGIPRGERYGTVTDALADAGLTDRADDRVGTLSGGLARRLDLVRGLLHRPAVSLLDEPTVGLDPLARAAFWSTLDARRDGAQLVATHDMDEAERCDRVVILDHGRVVADGTPSHLRASLGDDALWLDTSDSASLVHSLIQIGTEAVAVGDRVLVRTADARSLAGPLYDRSDVQGVSINPPTMADVFAHAVGSASHAPVS